MPAFSRTDGVNLTRYLLLPGRKVYVSFPNGNDTMGDGSESAPYKTIGRGAQDLRNGRNDVLVLIDGGTSSEGPVVISGKSNIAVVGLGFPALRPPTGRTAILPVSAWANAGGGIQATVPSGHGYVAGDYAFVHRTDSTASGTRIRGLGRVTSVTATTIVFSTLHFTLTNGQQPITGGAQGYITPCSLVFEDCGGVVVSGLFFDTNTFADQWNGVGSAIFAGSATRSSANVLFADCFFRNTSFGFAGYATDTPWGNGDGLVVERCAFTKSTLGDFVNPLGRTFGMLYLDRGLQVVLQENSFARIDAGGAADSADAFIHVLDDAKFSTLFTANRFDGSVAPGQGIALDKIVRVAPGRTLSRLFFEGNYYTHATVQPGQEDISVSTDGQIRERLAIRYPGQDLVPTQIEVIRRGTGVLDRVRVTGGTASAIQTTATQASGWYDGARVVVYGASGAAVATVHSYSQTNGTFTLESPLAFTPAAGDSVVLLGADSPHGLLDHPLSGHNIAGTVGESLTRIDAAVTTRAAPADVPAAVFGATEAAAAAAGQIGAMLVKMADQLGGNTEIDYTGSDLLGWQLVVRDRSAAVIERFNLFDETNARITGTVADFLAAKKAVSRLEKV